MNQIIIGAIAMAFAITALFFLRFWRETGDRLFAFFALSFTVLSINRVALGIAPDYAVSGDYFYWIRFLAFAIILFGILDKNWFRR